MRVWILRLMAVSMLLLTTGVSAETTIEWWQFWTDATIKPVIEEMVEEFEAQNPDIKVKLTDLTWSNGHEKIVVALSSGSGPDVLELGSDWIAQFADNGHLADISDGISDTRNDFDGWSMSTYRGGVYGHPWILGTRVVYLNRTLLSQTPFGADHLPITMVDLLTAAMAIDSLGDDTYGWGSNAAEKHRLYKKFLPFFWSNNAQLFTDDGELCVMTSGPGIDALIFYELLHDSCGYVANQRRIEDAFLDGKIGIILSGDWLLKRIELEKHNIDFATTLFPGRNGPGKSFMGGEFLAVNEASDHKAEAVKFIKFITSPENQVKFCKANRSANPSSREAQANEYFKNSLHLQTFISQLKLAKHPPVDPNWVHVEQYIEEAVEAVLFEDITAGEALYRSRVKIDELRQQ